MPKEKGKKPTKTISEKIKEQVLDEIDTFNNKKYRRNKKEVYYLARFKGIYCYLDRVEYGDQHKLGRLKFCGKIDNWKFAIYKYSREMYDPNECCFPGTNYLDGTITGAIDCVEKAYPISDMKSGSMMEVFNQMFMEFMNTATPNELDSIQEELISRLGLSDGEGEELLENMDKILVDLSDEIEDGTKTKKKKSKKVKNVEPKNVYQLKITLKNSKPPIWRRVQLLNNISFEKLHFIIQGAMGWEAYHLFGFDFPNGVSLDAEDPLKNIKIDEYIHEEKDKLIYTYDYGDSWEHIVVLEKILPIDEDIEYPFCTAGKKACPPEDCGGIWGYYRLLEVINDKSHPEYEEMLEWLGEGFDPDELDLEDVNHTLQWGING